MPRNPPWSTEDFRRQAEAVVRQLVAFVERGWRGEGKVVRLEDVEPLNRAMQLDQRLAGSGLRDEELEALVGAYLDGATNLHHPAYVAHQVAVPHYATALADLITGMLNNGMSVYEMGPSSGAVEIAVIDWMLAKVGWQPTGRNRDLPPEDGKLAGGGVLTHGGSLANLTALLAARASIAPDAWERGTPSDLVLLAPASAHYSISRAASIMGLGGRAVVPAPTDDLGRLLPDRLAGLHDEVAARGQRVMAVCANACATATGLYDPLEEVGRFCRERDLWFHVDGAHGASALLSSTESRRLAGRDLADSFVWDAHKLLQVSHLCAAALFRDGRALKRAFRQDAVYVTEGRREIGIDFIEHQFECTKAPLGLKLLLTLAIAGERGLASNIDRLWSATRTAHERIEARAGFQTLCPPESNILCFRGPGDDEAQARARLELMKQGDFLLSQAQVAGRRWLRLTIMNPLTDAATIDRLLDRIESLAG